MTINDALPLGLALIVGASLGGFDDFVIGMSVWIVASIAIGKQ